MKLFEVHANSSVTIYPQDRSHIGNTITKKDMLFEREDIIYEGPTTTGFIYRSNKQTYSVIVGNSDVRMIG